MIHTHGGRHRSPADLDAAGAAHPSRRHTLGTAVGAGAVAAALAVAATGSVLLGLAVAAFVLVAVVIAAVLI